MNGRTKTVSVLIREAEREGGEGGQSGWGQKEESLEVSCASEQPHLRHTSVEREERVGPSPSSHLRKPCLSERKARLEYDLDLTDIGHLRLPWSVVTKFL